jgi:hypothetical protein
MAPSQSMLSRLEKDILGNEAGLPEKKLFNGKYANLPSRWRFEVKNRSFVGFSPGKGDPKTIF